MSNNKIGKIVDSLSVINRNQIVVISETLPEAHFVHWDETITIFLFQHNQSALILM